MQALVYGAQNLDWQSGLTMGIITSILAKIFGSDKALRWGML